MLHGFVFTADDNYVYLPENHTLVTDMQLDTQHARGTPYIFLRTTRILHMYAYCSYAIFISMHSIKIVHTPYSVSIC